MLFRQLLLNPQNSRVNGSVVSKQDIRFVFTDGSRIVFRLSVLARLVQLFVYISNNLSPTRLNTTWKTFNRSRAINFKAEGIHWKRAREQPTVIT
ncbi:hypothetical protein OROGR_016034 [Orobanche gracilis]